MRRFLLILMSMALALAGGSTAVARDGMDVTPFIKAVPKAGQTISYAAGDDGAWRKGVNWATPRFSDSGNGTVTDSLTSRRPNYLHRPSAFFNGNER
jgi:hypothetical protein